MSTRHSLFIAISGALLASGCPGGGGEGDDESAPQSDIRAIDSSASARSTAKDIVEVVLKVRSGLPNGSYVAQSYSGSSGTARVSGSISYQSGLSCGSSCVRSVNDTDISIVFSNYVTNTASNTTTKLNGTVTFSDTRYSQQSGLSYSSGGRMSIGNSTQLNYELIGTDPVGTFGTRDTIASVSSAGSSTSDQHGSLTTASGGAYTF